MLKTILLNKANGVSKTTGKPWARVTLGCDHTDGSRSVSEFFISPEVYAKISGIKLDSYVYVTSDLDQDLHYSISDIRLVENK